MIVAEAAGSANGLGVVCLAQFLGEWILLKLWSVRGEFSQKFSGVCAAVVDSWSSFGNVLSRAVFGIGVILASLVMMLDFANAKLSS